MLKTRKFPVLQILCFKLFYCVGKLQSELLHCGL